MKIKINENQIKNFNYYNNLDFQLYDEFGNKINIEIVKNFLLLIYLLMIKKLILLKIKIWVVNFKFFNKIILIFKLNNY